MEVFSLEAKIAALNSKAIISITVFSSEQKIVLTQGQEGILKM